MGSRSLADGGYGAGMSGRLLASLALCCAACAEPAPSDSGAPGCGVPAESLPVIDQLFTGEAAFLDGGQVSGDASLRFTLHAEGSESAAVLDLYPNPTLRYGDTTISEHGLEVLLSGALCAPTLTCDPALGCSRGRLGVEGYPTANFEIWQGNPRLTLWIDDDEEQERAQLYAEEPRDPYFDAAP